MTQTARSLAIPYEAARDRFVRAFREAETSGESIRLAKRTTNLFRPRRSLAARRIPVDGLDRVIDVDVDAKVARVGGMTAYRTFTDATLPCGLMPAVVPELRSITVGGALTGIGIESSSWLHGLVHEAVDEIEILTGSGEVLVADRNGPHADLFFGFPNSYGTLGYALSVRVRLQEVSPCVRLMHVRFSSPDDLFTALADICDSGVHDETPVDFVDGSVFAADEADPGTVRRPPDDAGLPLALGHRLVLVLGQPGLRASLRAGPGRTRAPALHDVPAHPFTRAPLADHATHPGH
ncbi:MAG: FAD-binding oxidoreductase [Actinobacteria bacterium ATB1]|nr:FAD-binding oxidoreductase [Actinobacteria bacterium ATB1]